MRLRRSLHFVPGANEKMLGKALGLAADALILDLEDAVTADRKDAARAEVAHWLADVDFGRQERVVRMNAVDTPWGLPDLRETMVSPPDAYLVPKVESARQLHEIDAELSRLEAQHGHVSGSVRLLVLGTETPKGLFHIHEFGECPRVEGLSWGVEDLAAAIGATRLRDENGRYLGIFRQARHTTLLAACAAGVQPIDGVWGDITDLDGLRGEAAEAVEMGFTGKITIYPTHVDVVNEVFTPSAEEVEESRELVAEFEKHQRQGVMAFRFRGQMVDVPHLLRAQNLLERARLAGVA